MRKKILKCLKKIFIGCFHKNQDLDIVKDDEVIVRTLFSDLVRKSDNTVKPNAFKSYPKETDTVSVSRLDLTNVNFIKKFSLSIPKAKYCGLASIYARKIFNENATVVFSPTKDNPYHADLKIGFEVTKGKTLPAEFSEKIINIADKSKFHEDTCPTDDSRWCGDHKIEPNP